MPPDQLTLAGTVAPPPLPAGFVYAPNLLTQDEHDELVRVFDSWTFNEIVLRGVVARRTSIHFGYTYQTGSDTLAVREPWPLQLDWVRQRASAFSGVPLDALVQGLVNKYEVGAPIGWHRDRPQFGPTVVGFSLMSACRMRFRRGQVRAWETAEAELQPRSAYVIGGAARSEWEHSIRPAKEPRYSITFRTLR